MCRSSLSDSSSPIFDRLVRLLRSVCDGEIEVEAFCTEFEYLWNFEREPNEMAGMVKQRLKRVFDVVTWYSPYPDERKRIPGYKDEAAVLAAARETLVQLEWRGNPSG